MICGASPDLQQAMSGWQHAGVSGQVGSRREERRRRRRLLTCDFPPAPSTARVTERAQQITWILKKDPKKLLQPRASISCGDGGTWSSERTPALPAPLICQVGEQGPDPGVCVVWGWIWVPHSVSQSFSFQHGLGQALV